MYESSLETLPMEKQTLLRNLEFEQASLIERFASLFSKRCYTTHAAVLRYSLLKIQSSTLKFSVLNDAFDVVDPIGTWSSLLEIEDLKLYLTANAQAAFAGVLSSIESYIQYFTQVLTQAMLSSCCSIVQSFSIQDDIKLMDKGVFSSACISLINNYPKDWRSQVEKLEVLISNIIQHKFLVNGTQTCRQFESSDRRLALYQYEHFFLCGEQVKNAEVFSC